MEMEVWKYTYTFDGPQRKQSKSSFCILKKLINNSYAFQFLFFTVRNIYPVGCNVQNNSSTKMFCLKNYNAHTS